MALGECDLKSFGCDPEFERRDPKFEERDPKITDLKKCDLKIRGRDPKITECDLKNSERDPKSKSHSPSPVTFHHVIPACKTKNSTGVRSPRTVCKH